MEAFADVAVFARQVAMLRDEKRVFHQCPLMSVATLPRIDHRGRDRAKSCRVRIDVSQVTAGRHQPGGTSASSYADARRASTAWCDRSRNSTQ
jgi:hypothetical protein